MLAVVKPSVKLFPGILTIAFLNIYLQVFALILAQYMVIRRIANRGFTSVFTSALAGPGKIALPYQLIILLIRFWRDNPGKDINKGRQIMLDDLPDDLLIYVEVIMDNPMPHPDNLMPGDFRIFFL
jgi:hypothetical protein